MEKYNSFEEIQKACPIGSTTEETKTVQKYSWDEEPETPSYITYKVITKCVGYYYDGVQWTPHYVEDII